MKRQALLLITIIVLATLSGCASPANENQTAKACPDLTKIVEAFYAANDASQFETSVQYLTDDVVLVTWAEGANGNHFIFDSAVGKEQVKNFLGKPGLKRTADQPDLPNYTMQEVQVSPSRVAFKLIPDRLSRDNRPENLYTVEAFFSGCQIEILKVVERVTWL